MWHVEQEGDGLPDMIGPEAVDKAIAASGFEIIESRDAALDPNPGGIPWYQPLTPSWNIFTQRFQFNWLGMRLTKAALYVMEMVRGEDMQLFYILQGKTRDPRQLQRRVTQPPVFLHSRLGL